MAKEKEPPITPIARKYRVLVGCANDATGKRYAPGDTVRDSDFPASVIKNWLEIEPPVLELMKDKE